MWADAVPKKRGPKTDVLEALLKRVDGLEAKLKEKNAGEKSSADQAALISAEDASSSSAADPTEDQEPNPKRPAIDISHHQDREESAVFSPLPARFVLL